MKRQTPTLSRTAALLFAAAVLPATALLAQEAQPPADPPAAEVLPAPAPAPAETPPPADTIAVETPAPAPEATAPAAATTVRRAAQTPRARPTTSVTRTVRTAPAAPAPAPAAAAPAAPEAVPPPPAELIPPAAAPDVLPEAPAAVAPAPQPQAARTPSVLPWVLGGLLILGLAAFLLLRRRRRTAVVEDYDRAYDEPAVAAAPEPEASPVLAAAPLAAAAPAGQPRIELSMRPIRAGVGEKDARVEFQLTLDNLGNADAEDVRVSTWMLASGSSEMERALIEPRDHADTPPATIGAGEARTVEAAVAMPRGEVHGDSILPVVVADARYRLPDGSEGRCTATFAVGVPVEGELAHFDAENPSGLHEDVEARALS
ncbi:MAG TPA: hypothetical protein VHM92_01285 [Allosphingosinicella sp.]|nr:hypothetical protein [Allosphingosinicella sp.]